MPLKFSLLLLLFTLFYPYCSRSQNKFQQWLNPSIDSAYIEDYSKDIILRLYTSQKYSRQRIVDYGEKIALAYRPSNGYTLGAGINYKFLALNIGLVFPFTTPDPVKYGNTKHFDFQSHLYLRRFTIDFFTGYYKGQYLSNLNDFSFIRERPQNYLRDDLRNYSVGFGAYTNFNPRRYSLRSAFTQNEHQKKSAGQPTVGIEAYWVGSRADSSMVPSFVDETNFYDRLDFDRWGFYSINLTGGYAYTLVLGKRFFALASINASVGIGSNRVDLSDQSIQRSTNLKASLNERYAIGYQFDRIFVGLSWIDYQLLSPTHLKQTYINWNAGNMRFNLAYRLSTQRDYEIRPWKWFSSKRSNQLH